MEQQLQEFFNQLPDEIKQQVLNLPPEKQGEVIMQLMQRSQGQQVTQPQQFAIGGKVPIEVEKNENITTQDGVQPMLNEGYLKQLSYNPVSGQGTYEIPNDEHNVTHEEGGAGTLLKSGDVVNSAKTKIPVEFKVYGKNFKGKTFKAASDYLSKKEKELQKDYEKNVEDGMADKVTEGTLALMLAKTAKERNELNELQEEVLETNKQLEYGKVLEDNVKEMGGIVKKCMKAEEGLNVVLDKYFTNAVGERPLIKAAAGYNTSVKKFNEFADKLTNMKDSPLADVMTAFQQSGLAGSAGINGSQKIGSFKEMIASKESASFANPYEAYNKQSEKDPGAWGKYQFRWTYFKNDIKKLTGISTPQDFLKNPEAQEKVMDWHIQNNLLPDATELKQRYQLDMSIPQIMAAIHLEGKDGLEKKIKSGTMSTSTNSEGFKNASPMEYTQGFKWGGTMKAQGGLTVWKGDRSGINKPDYSLQDLQEIAKQYFPNKTYNSNKDLQQDIISYLDENFGGYQQYVNPVPQTSVTGKDMPSSLIDSKFGDDWNAAIKLLKTNKPVSIPTPDYKPQLTLTENDANVMGVADIKVPTEPNVGDDQQIPQTVQEQVAQTPDSTLLDKLKYGIRESLPYLDAIRLMRERRIMPTLQQKPYQPPDISTDYNIQDQLNQIDRTTQAAIADSRGNPSVRNARVAQLVANTYPAKNQAFSQKYNVETQLKNQESAMQNDYLNKWTDVNMGYKKQYEREVLQTIENQRQQKNMAIQKMMNDYIQKAQNKQNTELALTNTNYTWNPYSQKLELDPNKAAANFAQLKFLAGVKAGAYDENSKIVTIGSNQYVKKKNGNMECLDCEN